MSDLSFINLDRYCDLPTPPATERAWAAGFFDGEGWFGIHSGKYLRLCVVQTGSTVTLERFQAATGGHGRTYRRSANQPDHWARGWCFQINALADVTHAVNLMWEFLSEPKQEQITEAFKLRATYRATWPSDFPLPQRRLTDQQVREIRAALAAGHLTQRAIARNFGVSDYLISKIKHGKRHRAIQ